MEMQRNNEYQPLINLLNTNKEQLEIVKKTILKNELQQNIDLNNLLSSYIHMMVNRLFRDKQRLHELVCYDNLYRYYNFELAKNNSRK